MKRSKIGIPEDSQFTADEIEVAGIITCFHYYWRLSLRWGLKRRRSTLQGDESSATHNSKLLLRRDESSATHNSKLLPRRDESLLDISARENDYELEHGLQPTSCPNSKTHRELTETVVELSLEQTRLLKEVEKTRKTNQDLKDFNVYMKSQLALCLEQRQEQNMPYTSWSSPCDSDTRQKTETTASCDDFQRCDEREHFEKCSGSSALGSAYDKPQRHGRLLYPCSPESSFGSKKDGAMPSKDTGCSGFLDLNTPAKALFGPNSVFIDLNAPNEALFDTNSGFLALNAPDKALFGTNSGFLDLNAPDETLLGIGISNDLHDQILTSKNKGAAPE